jgi:FlaA1/EpsC-like NDP-sugar epimerase
MYLYHFSQNRSSIEKTKIVVIYGYNKNSVKLSEEFRCSKYKIACFCDDNKKLQGRSIDNIKVISSNKLKQNIKSSTYDLLVIAIDNNNQEKISNLYNEFNRYFKNIKILPSFFDILSQDNYTNQLQNISLEDLLARKVKDLDIKLIASFIENKTIMITGAGGSIGSEISKQCSRFKAKRLILVDNSEYNLYKIADDFKNASLKLLNVVDNISLEKLICQEKPDCIIHTAAYKHVMMCENNHESAIVNNIIGTKNIIDISIKYGVDKVVIISTDKAVRPTNVMGATKRVSELYANNVESNSTEIVAVRFGNVLGSSGSVVPKFKKQIQEGGPITVTHKDVTRYFMSISEACQLVLQTGAIAKGGELFVLDMGRPVKIVDLAKQMIMLYGKQKSIEIVFTGLGIGEKMYEELLIDDIEKKTKYRSIFVVSPTNYDIKKLTKDIENLLNSDDKIKELKKIVPEYITNS